jgi:hypothetical protein
LCVAAVVALVIQPACTDRERPDVSSIEVTLQSQRLDRDLASLDTNSVSAGLQQLSQSYPDFLNFYLDTLMGFGIQGNYSDSAAGIRQGLKPFLAHKDIRGLFDSVHRHFPDTKKVEEGLKEGFRYLKHYYPQYPVPKIVYFISGLNQWSVVTLDTNVLGIGLDMYLGEQYPFYTAVQIPQYVVRKCKPEYIPANALQAIYRNMHPFVMEDKNLLDLIIQRGKEQYFLSKVLPEAPDSIRFGYTQAQLNWCDANEADIYNFFITKNLLYETSPNRVHRYVFDGPTSAGMPAESPGNIGSWLGYQIINAYMKQNPETTLEQLFALADAQKLLQESKYRPK